jgi:hypothetical protein
VYRFVLVLVLVLGSTRTFEDENGKEDDGVPTTVRAPDKNFALVTAGFAN